MTEIKWRYCLDELPAYGEVIIRSFCRNNEIKDHYDTYPYMGLESYQGLQTVTGYREWHANMEKDDWDMIEFWWLPAKELPWPQEILDLHSFDPPAYVMRYKPQDEET